jgi:protein-arginine kinase
MLLKFANKEKRFRGTSLVGRGKISLHYFLYSSYGILSNCCTNMQDVEGDSLLSW